MTDLAQKPPSTATADATQQIVSAISHDFQGPTRLIRSFLQLLESELGDNLSEQAKVYLDHVTSAGSTLEERLGAITRLSRVSTLGQEPQPCRIQEAFEDALAILNISINESGSSVEIDETDAVVIADKAQLAEIFVQLVGNSLKFCTAPAKVRVGIEPRGDRLLISVRDNGPGFNARDSDAAFKLFRRFHKASVPGTGTGLTIVRRILERHEMSVSIKSSAETQTTVEFCLDQAAATYTAAS